MNPRKRICPKCHVRAGVDILYGMPCYEAVKLAERGEIALGGCCIDPSGPERRCTECGHEWRIRRRIAPFEKSIENHEKETFSFLDAFANEARAYCGWVTGACGEEMSVAGAVRRVCALYQAALNLPPPFTDGLPPDLSPIEPSKVLIALAAARAAALPRPLHAYWKVFDPISDPPEKPVAGSIVDDLGDIYGDIARPLLSYGSYSRSTRAQSMTTCGKTLEAVTSVSSCSAGLP